MPHVTVMILTTQTGCDLLQGSNVLSRLPTVNHRALGGVTHTHHKNTVDRRGHFWHSGCGNGVAITN